MKAASRIKMIITGLTLIFIIVGIGLSFLLSLLPPPIEFKKELAGLNTVALSSKQNQPSTAVNELAQQTSDASATQTAEIQSSKLNEEFGKRIFDSKAELVSVCENLHLAPRSNMASKPSEPFVKKLEESLAEETQDPFLESILIPLRFAVRLPRVQEFFLAVEKTTDQPQGLSEKATFYALAMKAYQEIQDHKKLINDVAEYAHSLYILQQVLSENPQLVNDPIAKELCHEYQVAIELGEEFNHKKNAERLLDFLEYAHVSPAEIRLNIERKSEFKFEFNSNRILMSLGWVSDLMNPQN